MSDTDSKKAERDFEMYSVLYAHASRIYSSTYIALYTTLLSYLVFFYTILQNRSIIKGSIVFSLVFILVDLGILLSCLTLFQRHVSWRNVTIKIEEENLGLKGNIVDYLYGRNRGLLYRLGEDQKWRGMTMGDIGMLAVALFLAIINLGFIIYFF